MKDHLHIDDTMLDDLLSALRRHDRADADRLLADWAVAVPPFPGGDGSTLPDPEEDDDDWWPRHVDHALTGWVHREIAQHVDGGRFEHALALVERYRRPLSADDMAARLTSPAPPNALSSEEDRP